VAVGLPGHLESLGVSFGDSPAPIEYAEAKTEENLRYAAGEHLALRTAAITASLRLPRRGSTVLRAMKHLSIFSWQRYGRFRTKLFRLFALVDVCAISSVFRKEKR
jgi:hypothetical protein